MDEIIIGIFKVQSDFGLEVRFSICLDRNYLDRNAEIIIFVVI